MCVVCVCVCVCVCVVCVCMCGLGMCVYVWCACVCVGAKQQINTGCAVHCYSEIPVRILRQYGDVQNFLAILLTCQQNSALFEWYKFCSALPGYDRLN
jgi:hypothetical protein